MTLQNIKISLRSDSLENWISSDPVLKNGELVMVNDISAGLVRFKIGNGVSAFAQLPYVNEKKVITDFAKAKRTESQYFSQGVNNFVSPLGFAAGNYITADSSFAQVLGINACSPEGHDYSFVWNGDSSGTIGVQSYRSHGEGTFNVNPVGGVDGFYVGNQTLGGILSSTYQPKGNYLSSNALDGYRTYDNTVKSLTAQSGFKTYADAKSSLSSDGYATHAQLDTKSSVSVDNQRADVNILHISQEEYDQLVVRNEVLSNFVYVVSGDYINAYEQQIKNLAPGTDISDAVNLEQLNRLCAGKADLSSLSSYAKKSDLDGYYAKSETYSSSEINGISAKLKSGIDDKVFINGLTAQSLSVIKLPASDYEELVANDGTLSNAIYIVDDSYEDMYGQQVKNVAAPTDPNDAATKNYVDQEIANLSDEYQPKGNYLTSHQSLGDYYTKTQVNALSTTFRAGLVESEVLDSYVKYIPGNTVTGANEGNKEYSVYIHFNFLDGGFGANITLYPLKTLYRNLYRSWYSHFDRPDFNANIEFTLDENDVSDGKLRLIVNSLGGSLTFDNVDFLENANITFNDILNDSFESTYVDSNYGRIQFRINYILDDTYAYYSAYSYSKDVIEKKINDAVLSSTENATPLAGKTYDLSQNGMFTKLVVDVGRALGATITNSPVDGLLAASIVDGDEMRFGN